MQNKKSKRDWQVYGLYRKDEEILFLERVKKTVWNMGAPWKPKKGGRSAFPNFVSQFHSKHSFSRQIPN